MSNQLFTFLLLLLSTTSLTAQQNADLLISFNKESLQLVERKAQSNFLQRLESEYLKRAGANANLVRKIYENATELGISEANSVVGFIDLEGDFAHIGLQFPLSDVQIFEQSIRLYAQNNLQNVEVIDTTITDQRIRQQLQSDREIQLARRVRLFSIQESENEEVSYILGANWSLTWTDTHAFLLKTDLLDAEIAATAVAAYYETRTERIEAAKLAYITQLSPIVWQDLSNDVSIRLSASVVPYFNEMTPTAESETPLGILFDEATTLNSTNQQIQVNFEAEAITVQLLENEEVIKSQIWTKEKLTRNWRNLEIEEQEDALAVWFKVLGQRFQFND